jgi:hypothetical protein
LRQEVVISKEEFSEGFLLSISGICVRPGETLTPANGPAHFSKFTLVHFDLTL